VGFPAVGFEEDLFEVQDDVGDIFDDAGTGGELVGCAFDFDGTDAGTFERAEEHAAQGIADGVAVTDFKRFGDELGVRGCGAGFLADQALGHFETTETDWHGYFLLMDWVSRALESRTNNPVMGSDYLE
jgi:hypothetical protein